MYLEYKNCRLCPRKCSVDRESGNLGFCKAGKEAQICRIGLHYMEEPVISGKNGSGTIFFAHCNLKCIYCQNFEISRDEVTGKTFIAEQMAEEMLKLQKNGAHNINLVTPTHYLPAVIDTLQIAKEKGLTIPVVYNTSGFETEETINSLKGLVDIYLTDLKYFSPYYSGLYSSCEDYFDYTSQAIEKMIENTGAPVIGSDGLMKSGVIIRHLMLPGLGGDTAQILKYIASHWGDKTLVSLMRQYTPICDTLPDELCRTITDKEYNAAAELFYSLGLEGFVQDSTSVGKDKIPDWKNK